MYFKHRTMKSTALITGGSSGIGFELARLFARDGWDLFLVAKPAEELEAAQARLNQEFPAIVVQTLTIDLAHEKSAQQVYDAAQQQNMQVDALVNNAGFGTYGFINDISMQQELDMIHLNVLAVYQLTRLFLRDMIARNQGNIVNLSSISAFQPNPELATYGATKSFVLFFSRAIAEELRMRKSAVRVTAVCPTPVINTGFQAAAGMEKSRLFESWMVVTPDVVARDIYKAMKQGRSYIIPGPGFHLLHKLVRRLPDAMVLKMAKDFLKVR